MRVSVLVQSSDVNVSVKVKPGKTVRNKAKRRKGNKRAPIPLDPFGCRTRNRDGTVPIRHRINRCLDRQPKTLDQIARESGQTVRRCRSRLKHAMEKRPDLLAQCEEGWRLLR